MARVWPASKCFQDPSPENTHVSLPPIHVQDLLLDLYFTYVHPTLPVIHKTRFLAEYNSRCRFPKCTSSHYYNASHNV